MKTLIAFFSRADENYIGGALRNIEVGNTEIVVVEAVVNGFGQKRKVEKSKKIGRNQW